MSDFRKMLATLWTGLSWPQRVSIAASLAVCIAVLAATIAFSSRPNLTLLYSGLDPSEAAKIVQFLQQKKVPHDIDDGGRAIRVPATSVHQLRLELASQGIPRTADSAGGVGFEIFDKPTFGMSDFMQKANYYRALQGELARTIRQFDEVEAARVLIVVPEERLFARDRREAKASVFLMLKPGRTLGQQQVQAIRFLVANGVENLQPGRVAIVDSSGRALAENEDSNSLSSIGNQQQAMVRAFEENLREKTQSMLDQVLGFGQSVVRVTAELDFDAVQETAERFDPRGAVPRTETTTTESSTSRTTSGTGAVAGVGGNTTPNDGSQNQSTTQSRESITNQYEINRVVETRNRAPGTVRRVTTAVLINARRPAPVAATGTTGAPAPAPVEPRTPQELKALEDLIRAAVGFTQNAERQDVIQIKETEFAPLFPDIAAEPAGMPITMQLDRWLPYASQGFLVLLAIAIFFYFRTLVSSSRRAVESREFSELLNRYEQLTEATVDQVVTNRRTHLSVDEMQRLLRENPGNTAQAIRNWLGKN
jgi:flagellar M-ring protein FliF